MNEDDETYTSRENQWDQQWPSESAGRSEHATFEPDAIDELTGFPGHVGTGDPIESVRDAEPYTPPIDPPLMPGGEEGVEVATGFGVSPEEELYTQALPRGDEELRDEATRLLHDDSLTSTLPLHVHVREGVIHLHGQVTSTDEAEHATWILSDLPGVIDVVDDTVLEPNAAR